MMTSNQMNRLQLELYRWSCDQFGSHSKRNAIGPANHLAKKEAIELRDAVVSLVQERESGRKTFAAYGARKDVLEEMADCIMLILDTASRLGIYWSNIENRTWEKLDECRKRQWQPLDEDGISEHVRGRDYE